MAVVAHRSADVLDKTAFDLDAGDKMLLSQRVNQLSELIYAQSTQLQGIKGYLAIFRNLTDAQPLTDRVLARLVELDRPAVPQIALPTCTGSLPPQPPANS
jgi:hypothetical protein